MDDDEASLPGGSSFGQRRFTVASPYRSLRETDLTANGMDVRTNSNIRRRNRIVKENRARRAGKPAGAGVGVNVSPSRLAAMKAQWEGYKQQFG